MQAKDLINQLKPDQIKLVAIVSVGLVFSGAVYVFKKLIDFFTSMRQDISSIKDNHLHTIQENTGKTVELLEKMVEGQAELNGYIRGKLE